MSGDGESRSESLMVRRSAHACVVVVEGGGVQEGMVIFPGREGDGGENGAAIFLSFSVYRMQIPRKMTQKKKTNQIDM